MPKILIVDDEWLTRLEIEEMLNDLGYDVAGQAETGAEAIEMARELNPDLILMDVEMPGEMNGIDAAREIKTELGTPIVFISGHGDPEYIEAAKEIAPFGYVMKPFDEKEVHAFVEIALSRRKLELTLEKAQERLEQTNLDLQEEIEVRKKTERTLLESQKLYRDIFEKNNAIKWLLDPATGEIIDANSAACEFYQYSHDEITKLRVWEINVESEAEVRKLLACINSDRNTEFITKHRLASGEIRDVQVYSGTLESGGKRLLHSIIIDVTDRVRAEEALKHVHNKLEQRVKIRTAELAKANKRLQEENEARKRSEKALRENERHLRSLMESVSNFAVYRLISDGDNPNLLKVMLVSPSITDILGLSEPMRFETWFEHIHPDDVERIVSANIEAFETLRFDETMRVYHFQKQKWIWIHSVSTGFEDKEYQCMYVNGILIDITKEKEAEKALGESEEKYRNLVEESFDGIFIQSGQNIIFANKRLNEMLGYGEGELIGQDHWAVYHPEFQELTRERARARMGGEKVMRRYEVKLQRKDGSWFFGEINARSITFPSGEMNGIQVWVKDIHERRRAEEERDKLQAQLQRAQKMEALGLLAGGVAHDLNNILSGIVSYPELILLDLPEDSPLRKPMKIIQESGMRAADVVADLLTIGRGVVTGKETLNLNTIVGEYLASAEYQELENAHAFVHFRTELGSDLLNMSGSATHLKKTLMNLVTNASEAIVEGDGTIIISTLNRYLDEPLKGYEDVRTGEYTVLTVSDNGPGISPPDLERIFEPFYTKKEMGRSGTGLGLTIVWNTVQDHNGYINVMSSEKGTQFELYFPVTREQITQEEQPIDFKSILGHGEKILVVDDEEKQRVIASGILTRLGYMAEAVSSGEEAIEYVKKNPIDLILLDMVMTKGINGQKTYEEIIKIRPGQKAIIASGYAKTKEVDLAQGLGAGKYVKKPYTLSQVGVAVKEELEK